MAEPSPLWERREREQDDSWFHAVKYPFSGAWYPVRWQGFLLLMVEGLLLFLVFGTPGGMQTELPELLRDGIVWVALGAFVILFSVAIVKTRWRWG